MHFNEVRVWTIKSNALQYSELREINYKSNWKWIRHFKKEKRYRIVYYLLVITKYILITRMTALEEVYNRNISTPFEMFRENYSMSKWKLVQLILQVFKLINNHEIRYQKLYWGVEGRCFLCVICLWLTKRYKFIYAIITA